MNDDDLDDLKLNQRIEFMEGYNSINIDLLIKLVSNLSTMVCFLGNIETMQPFAEQNYEYIKEAFDEHRKHREAFFSDDIIVKGEC